MVIHITRRSNIKMQTNKRVCVEQEPSETGIGDLPFDVLVKIIWETIGPKLRKGCNHMGIGNCARVSKLWKQASYSPLIWSCIRISFSSRRFGGLGAQGTIPEYFAYIKGFVLSAYKPSTSAEDDIVHKIFSVAKNTYFVKIFSFGTTHIPHEWIDSIPATTKEIEIRGAPCTHSDESICRLFERCDSLKKALFVCWNSSPHILLALQKHFTTLRTVYVLNEWFARGSAFINMGVFPNIKNLVIGTYLDIEVNTDDLSELYRSFPGVVKLCLTDEIDGTPIIRSLCTKPIFPELRYLTLDDCILESRGGDLGNLRTLHLRELELGDVFDSSDEICDLLYCISNYKKPCKIITRPEFDISLLVAHRMVKMRESAHFSGLERAQKTDEVSRFLSTHGLLK